LRVWRRHGFDVIHAANPPDFFFLLGLFYGCFAKKFVFDQHDLSPELFQVLFQARLRPLHKALCVLERCSYRFAHVVLTANESFRRRALERGGCSPEKVFVVRNGPDLALFNGERSVPDLPFPNRKKYMLIYVGVMGEQDGVEYALYALYYLVYVYGHKDVSAVFIGNGSSLCELQRLVGQLGLEEYTFFTGWLEKNEIVRYLASADIGLQPDPQNGLNEFCTMLKAMEYMAMGLPFVAFDLPETRLLADGAALYARPNEVGDFARQLDLLLNCEERRRTMGAVGRRRAVEIVNWEHSRKDLLIAYESLFSDRKVVELGTAHCAGKKYG
jgi:glycosyltransferase involved in cell wall biosynthesis